MTNSSPARAFIVFAILFGLIVGFGVLVVTAFATFLSAFWPAAQHLIDITS